MSKPHADQTAINDLDISTRAKTVLKDFAWDRGYRPNPGAAPFIVVRGKTYEDFLKMDGCGPKTAAEISFEMTKYNFEYGK